MPSSALWALSRAALSRLPPPPAPNKPGLYITGDPTVLPMGTRRHEQGFTWSLALWKYCKVLFLLQMLSKVSEDDRIYALFWENALPQAPPPSGGVPHICHWGTSVLQTPYCSLLEKSCVHGFTCHPRITNHTLTPQPQRVTVLWLYSLRL